MGLSDSLAQSLLYATLAGAAIPLGACIAKIEHIRPNWLEKEFRHSVIAFGGGVLVSAISFVLVPEGAQDVPAGWAVFAFLFGGLCFYVLDRIIEQNKGPYSQLIAMLTDFIPEALAMGAMLATGNNASILLVLLIASQNLPEGFNAYREIMDSGHHKARTVLIWFCLMVLFGPLAAFVGGEYLSNQTFALGFIMLFSAGGILYLVFQDIAPQAYLKKRWLPPLGAVFGYSLGLVGHLFLH
jgi:zinc transporter, ZIP family